jgi:prepilin-type N-terminal cleavage/methylation domain-containing protein
MRRRAFTLIELLITITIIGIMAGLIFGALVMAQEAGKQAATKATIAKLNSIIMRRYESYMTRRVPIRIDPCPGGLTTTQQQAWMRANYQKRLDCIRDIMRMEMPDAATDVTGGPIAFTFAPTGGTYSVAEPALHRVYTANPPSSEFDSAQCLYKVVAFGSPAEMEHFSQGEVGMTADGKPVFVDGWGMPIMWLRWAPGWRSELQTGDPVKDHDPFDPRMVDPGAFRLVPLIYSASGKRGPDGKPLYGVDLQGGQGGSVYIGDPYHYTDLGSPAVGKGAEGIITNHLIDAR